MTSTIDKSFEARRQIYLDLYKSMSLNSNSEEMFLKWYEPKFLFNKTSYEDVGKKLGIPWFFIGCIAGKETSFDMSKGLHNGEPWNQVTTMVPRGRGPFQSWNEAAIDAIIYDGLHLNKDWSIPKMLWCLEKYNGFGYIKQNINSPYLWSGSNQYSKGLFLERPVIGSWFDQEAKADDLGAAVMIYLLEKHGHISLNEKPLNIVQAAQSHALPSSQKEEPDNKVAQKSFLSRLINFFRNLISR